VSDINANITKIGGEPIELSAARRSPELVAEVFGRGRFLDRARRHGLSQGFALDLSTGWDLNIEAQRQGAAKLQHDMRPVLQIGSPRSAAWSNPLNFGTARPETVDGLICEAFVHMDFCFSMYREQMCKGRYFLHEAPRGARSWHTRGVQDLLAEEGVLYVRNDQCEAGQTVPVRLLDGCVRQAGAQAVTGWMTNSRCIAKQLEQFQCRSRLGALHQHHQLLSGAAARKAAYPTALTDAIVRGFRQQLENDKKSTQMGISVNSLDQGYNWTRRRARCSTCRGARTSSTTSLVCGYHQTWWPRLE